MLIFELSRAGRRHPSQAPVEASEAREPDLARSR
jgi:hypothetical protein